MRVPNIDATRQKWPHYSEWLSASMQQKTSDRCARYQNRLWHSPAKENQKGRDSNSQRGDIVNGPACQHDYSPRDGTRRGRRHSIDERADLRAVDEGVL